MGRWLRGGAMLAVVSAACWWLFADTIAHYQRESQDGAMRFAHFGSYSDYQLWSRIIDAFEATHPNLRVQQEFVPGWYGQYETKLRQQVLSGTLPDVSLIQLGPFARLSRHFASLEDCAPTGDAVADILSALDATAVRAFAVGDGALTPTKHRGVPVAGGDLLIYLNPECFATASQVHGEVVAMPDDSWTIESFESVAERLTCDADGDGRLDQWGFWLPRFLYYLPFTWSFGATVVDDAGRWAFRDAAAAGTMRFYRGIARDRRVCPTPAEVPQLIQDVGFVTGKVAMCVNGPWFEPFLARTHLRDRYVVMPIPRGPDGHATRVTWDALCVSRALSQQRRRAAFEFVSFCVSTDVQRMIARAGRSIPARRDAISVYDQGGRNVRRRAFVDALAYARLQPMSGRFAEVDRAINRHLQRFIRDDCDLTATGFLDVLAHDEAIVGAFGTPLDERE